jgi:hypothetical protein
MSHLFIEKPIDDKTDGIEDSSKSDGDLEDYDYDHDKDDLDSHDDGDVLT